MFDAPSIVNEPLKSPKSSYKSVIHCAVLAGVAYPYSVTGTFFGRTCDLSTERYCELICFAAVP